MLTDLQFLAAAGEGDAEEHNGVLALIRSYLCLLKAEHQVLEFSLPQSHTAVPSDHPSLGDLSLPTSRASLSLNITGSATKVLQLACLPWAAVETAEHGLQASVEHDSAAESILRLLSNRMLPPTGQLPILYQAVPVLERQTLPPLFSVKDTSKLLAHLQVPS